MTPLESAALDVLREAWVGTSFRIRTAALARALGQPAPAVREALTGLIARNEIAIFAGPSSTIVRVKRPPKWPPTRYPGSLKTIPAQP
jgi:hypothetical protein